MINNDEMTAEEIQLNELLHMLSRMNNVLDHTAYLLAENHEAECYQLMKELLRIVIKINMEIDDLIEVSAACSSNTAQEIKDILETRKAELRRAADDHIMEVSKAETRFFTSMKADPALFEKSTSMVYSALDTLDESPDEVNLIIEGGPGDRYVCLTKDGKVQGALVQFADDDPQKVALYEGGKLLFEFEFSPDGENGNLVFDGEQDSTKSSLLPFLGSAAILGAAAAAALLKPKKKSTKAKVLSQEVVNANSKK